MMEMMGQEFPGAFSGYKLAVTESHQRTKADTSGTAKAVVSSFQRLGLEFPEVQAIVSSTCMCLLVFLHGGFVKFVSKRVPGQPCAHQSEKRQCLLTA